MKIRKKSLRQLIFQKNLFAIIKSEPDNNLAEQKTHEMVVKRKSKMNEQQLREFAQVEVDIKTQLPLVLSPWYRYFLAYNPRPTLEKVKIPVLALNGENDLQVSAKENLDLIAAALKAGKIRILLSNPSRSSIIYFKRAKRVRLMNTAKLRKQSRRRFWK